MGPRAHFETLGSEERAGSFPPYSLLDGAIVARVEKKHRRLKRVYSVAQRHSWDGDKLLAELLEKHGGIQLPTEKREAIASVLSVILWGELAAWDISADIALKLDDVDAKMAASSQVFDEARHFHTMRAYLQELQVPIPPLDAYTRTILSVLLESRCVMEKLIGMQLLVENIAVQLFRAMIRCKAEPVLVDLLPYFIKDEARHVGLGVLYLPGRLEKLGRLRSAQLTAFQFKITTLMFWATVHHQDAFHRLGIDLNRVYLDGMREQYELFDSMGHQDAGLKGVYVPTGVFEALNRLAVRVYFPPPEKAVAHQRWRRGMRSVSDTLARWGGRVLDVAQ